MRCINYHFQSAIFSLYCKYAADCMIISENNAVSFIRIFITLGLENTYLLERVILGCLDKQIPLHLSSIEIDLLKQWKQHSKL